MTDSPKNPSEEAAGLSRGTGGLALLTLLAGVIITAQPLTVSFGAFVLLFVVFSLREAYIAGKV